MKIEGPVYVILMELHRTLIKAGDMEALLIATARATAATRLDPRKNDRVLFMHGPFRFDFRAVNRSDVQPHWAGALHYDDQTLPLYRWNDGGTLLDLGAALAQITGVQAVFVERIDDHG
jgi:hypothetical protein